MKKSISIIFILICGISFSQQIYFPKTKTSDYPTLEKNIKELANLTVKRPEAGDYFMNKIIEIHSMLLLEKYPETLELLDSVRAKIPVQAGDYKKTVGIEMEAYAKTKINPKSNQDFSKIYTETLTKLLDNLNEREFLLAGSFVVASELNKEEKVLNFINSRSSDSISMADASSLVFDFSNTQLYKKTYALSQKVFRPREEKLSILREVFSGGKLNSIQENMDIKHYDLDIDLDIPNKFLMGNVKVKFNLLKTSDSLQLDLVRIYKIKGIKVDKKPMKFEHVQDKIFIVNANNFQPGIHEIEIEYSGKTPIAVNPPWQGGFSYEFDADGNPEVFINCQLEGGKIYFPCKDHPSDEPDEGVDLFVKVPENLSVAAFGMLQSANESGNGTKTFHWKTNYTISNYCILFNVAKYEVAKRTYTTINNHQVPVELYYTKQDSGLVDKILEIRLRDTKILEKYFGEYPWYKEKIGIGLTTISGMEHQTMVTYAGGDRVDFKEFPNFIYSDNLLHEFAHEWFANKVTNKDWAHMWIQEGIATYIDPLFFLEMQGEEGYRRVMREKRNRIDNSVPIVLGEGLDSGKAYLQDIYDKGAFVMHNLRFVMGDEKFFPALKSLSADIKEPYNVFWTSDDVEKHFSKAAGKNLKPFFDFYLYTTNYFNFSVKKIGENEYEIACADFPMLLPLEVQTDSGIQKFELEKSSKIKITSKTQPIADPNDWYFKKLNP